MDSISKYYGKQNTNVMGPYSSYMNTERQLPNGGGSYSVAGAVGNPSGDTGIQDMFNAKGTREPDAGIQDMFNAKGTRAPEQSSIFQGGQSPAQPEVDLYAKYRDPETGDIMSPEEYSSFLGSKVPQQKGNGDVGQYAGDSMANPDESSASLNQRATNLNNTRNDIATGTTDPYDFTQGGNIVYSPSDLEAIEKAYAGIYDPIQDDIFARLKTREEAAKRDADREDKIFSVNENIRQWKATTGSRGGSEGGVTVSNKFSQDQINKGSSKAGMTEAEFLVLDPDLANYFVNPPKYFDIDGTEQNELMSDLLANLVQEVKNGEITNEEAAAEIMEGNLPAAVKVYLVSQLPATPEETGNWFTNIFR